jgi:hypothetical protein
LFAADDLAVRLVLFTGFLRDRGIYLCDDLRSHSAGADEGSEQCLDALRVVLFESARQLELPLPLGELGVRLWCRE